ncbi:hypothetical protein NGRA_1080 [Nosema granulosis]|uniref:Uncharacterized protein n=1 Tax=Nosema granulosis TaxID=83296 RepID=A0A9P6H1U7_9MICR|nr:hypothetical protein NGRA_1080 [Nosema granulosis]
MLKTAEYFIIGLIFCLVLILIAVTCTNKENRSDNKNKEAGGENKKSLEDVKKLFTSETYEAFRNYEIDQSDDTIKAILISVYNISSVDPSFLEKCVESTIIKNTQFYLSDRDMLITRMTNFNKSFNTRIFQKSKIKNVFEIKHDENDDFEKFFTYFRPHETILEQTKVLNRDKILVYEKNIFYETIVKDFKKNFPEEYKFVRRQFIVFEDKKYPVFEYVYKAFITFYITLAP